MAADRSVRVEVRGVKELNRAFAQVDKGLKGTLKAEFLPLAQHVADLARRGVPRIDGDAAGSIVGKASDRGASIAFGGRKAEYQPWLDFGGHVGRHRSIARPIIPGGRYVYPAIAESKGEIGEAALEAVEKAAEKARFEVRG